MLRSADIRANNLENQNFLNTASHINTVKLHYNEYQNNELSCNYESHGSPY